MQAPIPKTRREKKNIEPKYISFLELNMYTRIEAQPTQDKKRLRQRQEPLRKEEIEMKAKTTQR